MRKKHKVRKKCHELWPILFYGLRSQDNKQEINQTRWEWAPESNGHPDIPWRIHWDALNKPSWSLEHTIHKNVSFLSPWYVIALWRQTEIFRICSQLWKFRNYHITRVWRNAKRITLRISSTTVFFIWISNSISICYPSPRPHRR